MSDEMKLDVRLPIGGLFATDGLLLLGYGLFGNRAEAMAKAGFNVTLGWGVVLLVFGAGMLGFALKARHVRRPAIAGATTIKK
jgi:hypothetical protein